MLYWKSYKSEVRGQEARASPTNAEPVLFQTILRVSLRDRFQIVRISKLCKYAKNETSKVKLILLMEVIDKKIYK